MSITLTGTGGLFTRLGKLIRTLNVLNEFRGQSGSALATDLPAEVLADLGQVDGGSLTIRQTFELLGSAQRATLAGMSSMTSAIKAAAQNLLIQQVHADHPLTALDVPTAIAELNRQLALGPTTVQANAVTATPAAGGSNYGDGVLTASILDGRGRKLEYAFAETLALALTSNATAGSEIFSCLGVSAIPDKLNQAWPGGSGSANSLAFIDAAASLNLLSNGTFDTFTTPNEPDDWDIDTGLAGTDIFSEASTVYAGAKALKLLGDGSTLTQLHQTLTGLTSRTPYALHLWARTDDTPAAGVLKLDLWDGSAVINDDAGTPNSLTIDLTTLSDSAFEAKSAYFRLPEPIPATVQLRIRLSTALESGKSVYVDHLSLARATQLYQGGPFAAGFSGATPFALDDVFTLAITNDYAGKFQTGFLKLFDLAAINQILLSAASSPAISDSLAA